MESLQVAALHRPDLEQFHHAPLPLLVLRVRGGRDQSQDQIHSKDQDRQDQTSAGVCRNLLQELALLPLTQEHGLQTQFPCNSQDLERR